MTVTGQPPTADLLVLGRILANRNEGFACYWEEFQRRQFDETPEDQRARHLALDALRHIANHWLLSAAERRRRGLTGPNGDRNARGRHFFSALRRGVVLTPPELDRLITGAHKDSKRGVKSAARPAAPSHPELPRGPSPALPIPGQAWRQTQGGTGAPPTSAAAPAQAGSSAQVNPAPAPPHRDLNARNAPLVPPQGNRNRSRSKSKSGGPPPTGTGCTSFR